MHVRHLSIAAPLVALFLLGACEQPAGPTSAGRTVAANRSGSGEHGGRHILLISIDGLHAVDLEHFVASHPHSTLAELSRRGTTYSNASSSKPSDSYPGLLALVTGGTARSTGVYYDDSYDRRLAAPGSDCSVRGTEVVYDESVDYDPTRLDAGGGIDPTKLPLDPDKGCTPAYPHSFLRVNTIFEVIKAAGMRTAWSDKHPSYDLVNGPSGQGVQDLYSPEIAATLPNGGTPADNVANAEYYDDIKVPAIINEIDGLDHSGAHHVGVPAIFGMNFQAVSVGEKTSLYRDASGTPSADLEDALEHTDASIGRFVSELEHNDLLENTVIIIGAKHGQSPIDPARKRIVSSKVIPGLVEGIESGLLAQGTQDDIALLWLTDHRKAHAVQKMLLAQSATDGVMSVLAGEQIRDLFGDPRRDSRVPDVVALPEVGVIYTKLTATKTAEHGGFSEPDTHVGLLIAGPGFGAGITDGTPVENRQVAPTILEVLGLSPAALQSVQIEGTTTLPRRGERGER